MDSGADRPAAVRPSLLGRALVLIALAGPAITQPVLDPMGPNPEFFVAGSYTSAQIIWFGAIVALVPSVVHLILVAGLGALFGNVLVRGLGLAGGLLGGDFGGERAGGGARAEAGGSSRG